MFHTGMDEYGYGDDGGSLTGSATYSGSATGVYVDSNKGGLFTARAMLTATFSGTNDDTLTGRIDNFRETRGDADTRNAYFVGNDTAAQPNDPAKGGDNDWVVNLGRSSITGTGATGSQDTDGKVTGSATASSGPTVSGRLSSMGRMRRRPGARSRSDWCGRTVPCRDLYYYGYGEQCC